MGASVVGKSTECEFYICFKGWNVGTQRVLALSGSRKETAPRREAWNVAGVPMPVADVMCRSPTTWASPQTKELGNIWQVLPAVDPLEADK